ncbi:MAG: AMP-binding protein [Cyanobacteria bacterium P01_C01_bin.118]
MAQNHHRPVPTCIHHLFEQQVQKTPQAVAITTDTEQITYQQLNRQANRLAYQLSTLDIGPHQRVGICVEYSIDMILGLLGVLKTGSAYIPIDPHTSAIHTDHILRDSQIKVLLTQTHLEDSLATHLPGKHLTLLCLDRDQWIRMRSCPDLNIPVTADDLVNITYIPNSTNLPKKVKTSHRSTYRQLQTKGFLDNQAQILPTLSLSSTSSLEKICWPLITGGQLLMPHRDKR